MKRLAILFLAAVCFRAGAVAQTFTQHLQQPMPEKGRVTVTQSKEIDNLVNGLRQKADTAVRKKPVTVGNGVVRKRENTEGTQPAVTTHAAASSQQHAAGDNAHEHATERQHTTAQTATDSGEEEMHIPTVDMRKKVMRGSRKVTGFRVQAFAGGNTRADRQKAQRTGDAIKMKYPDVPVYVHFYSPRWICRIGNFKTYGEAAEMLKAVKAMGYKSATIVKGKITVFE